MQFYRFKSCPETIVQKIGDNLVQIVWAKSWKYGDISAFIYRLDKNNLSPLSKEECKEVIIKRKAKGLVETKYFNFISLL